MSFEIIIHTCTFIYPSVPFFRRSIQFFENVYVPEESFSNGIKIHRVISQGFNVIDSGKILRVRLGIPYTESAQNIRLRGKVRGSNYLLEPLLEFCGTTSLTRLGLFE